MTSVDIESLFIEKFTERYKLNERDVKKAFSRFDTDTNGLLDLTEIEAMFKLFLNGINPKDIHNFVTVYDVNGDQKISHKEFLTCLTTRKGGSSNDVNNNSSNNNNTSSYPPQKSNINNNNNNSSRIDYNNNNNYNNNENDYDLSPDSYSRPLSSSSYQRSSNNQQPPQQRTQTLQRQQPQQQLQYNQAPLSSYRGDEDSYAYDNTDENENYNQSNYNRNNNNRTNNTSHSIGGGGGGYSNDTNNDNVNIDNVVRGYLRSLRAYLSKTCTDRNTTSSTTSKLSKTEKLSLSASKLVVMRVSEFLMKEFQPYTGIGDGSVKRNTFQGVAFQDFCKVLRKLRVPGGSNLSQDALEYLFGTCCPLAAVSSTNNNNNAAPAPMADPHVLLNFLFPEEVNNSSSGGGGNSSGLSVTSKRAVDDLPVVKAPQDKLVESYTLGFVKGKSRATLAAPSNLSANAVKRSQSLPPFEFVREHIYGLSTNLFSGNSIHSLPLAQAAYSGRGGPAITFNNSSSSNGCTVVYAAGCVGVVHDLTTNQQKYYEGHTDDISCMTLSSDGSLVATGCVRSTGVEKGKSRSTTGTTTVGGNSGNSTGGNKNSSSTNNANNNSINAVIHIWSTAATISSHPSSSDYNNLSGDFDDLNLPNNNNTNNNTGKKSKGWVLTVGIGFFERAVSAVMFSNDMSYLCGIGADDNHHMGIWALSSLPTFTNNNQSNFRPSAVLVAEVNCLHGLPTDLKWLAWAANLHHTAYITKEHVSFPCDVLCTTGDRHLRLWSFKRPYVSTTDPATQLALQTQSGVALRQQQLIVSRSCVIPQAKVSKLAAAPKIYTCAVFSTTSDGNVDMISGGSNGVVYLWRQGECIATSGAIKGGVTCLAAQGEYLYCGGTASVLKVLDVRTLKTLLGFDLMSVFLISNAVSSSSNRPSSESGVSSARGRPTSSASTSHLGLGGLSSARRPSSASSANGSRSASVSSLHSARRGSNTGLGGGGRMIGIQQSAQAMAGKKSVADTKPAALYGCEEESTQTVVGITVVTTPSIGGMSQNASLLSLYVIATTSAGRCIRINVGKSLGSNSSDGSGGLLTINMSTLFYYHTGTLTGLCTQDNATGSLLVTSGEDKRICVWNIARKQLVSRFITKIAVTCVAFDQFSKFIAAGLSNGGVSVYAYIDLPSSSSSSSAIANRGAASNTNIFGVRDTLKAIQSEFTSILKEAAFRKDAKEGMNDIKFSPDNNKIAAGSRDNYIYVYSCVFEESNGSGSGNDSFGCVLRPLTRIAGHSSFITHLDWSADSQLLQSTCGAYELLCWTAETGKPYTVTPPADIIWDTNSCVLGFCLMGIWGAYSNGGDINSVDVSPELNLVVTGDDQGKLNLLTYPCVVKNAPRKIYNGHSSHCTKVHFIYREANNINNNSDSAYVATLGGRDSTMAVWRLLPSA